MDFWDFEQTDGGQWTWRCLSEAGVSRQAGGFRSRNDCIADAMRNGYLRDPTASAALDAREGDDSPDDESNSPLPFSPHLLAPRC